MKIPKTLLQTIVIAVAAGSIASCKKPTDEIKAAKEKTEKTTPKAPDCCPACGMG
ncbi:MAG TPA: hypothetical protein PLY34_20085 [Ferruginibacter sp.]|nr:hypothetical protein [Ferruginibacter sp.]